MEPRTWRLIDLGLAPYHEAWRYQSAVLEDRLAGKIGDTLILVEHPPVITLGAAATENEILVSRDVLAAKGIEVTRVNRGGNITYHGPGQIVGYPIIDLTPYGCDVHLYVHKLEEAIIGLLASYNIKASRLEGYPGVWVEVRKIAARGVYIKRWVTMHGFSLNVHPDLSHFALINPCGIVGCKVTSMAAELGGKPDMAEVKARLAQSLAQSFGVEIEPVSTRPDSRASCQTSASGPA